MEWSSCQRGRAHVLGHAFTAVRGRKQTQQPGRDKIEWWDPLEKTEQEAHLWKYTAMMDDCSKKHAAEIPKGSEAGCEGQARSMAVGVCTHCKPGWIGLHWKLQQNAWVEKIDCRDLFTIEIPVGLIGLLQHPSPTLKTTYISVLLPGISKCYCIWS